MKIQVLSDLHIEQGAYDFVDAGVDLVVLAGDIHRQTEGVDWAISEIRDKPVLYVLGNHEYYSDRFPGLVDDCRSLSDGTNVKVLEREGVEFDGYRFFGATLWTDFGLYGKAGQHARYARVTMNDYRVIRNNKTGRGLEPRETIRCYNETVAKLSDFLDTGDLSRSIVITHHLPSFRSVHRSRKGDPLSAAFASRLDRLIELKGPSVWIHGHNHDCLDYTIGKTRVYSNQRGYPGEEVRMGRFDGLATIDLDAERSRFANGS
ncbi:metallophosphoesterase [Pelagicoccus sp. SDUM812005]|uniref:metallophosphoesterase n=1 Tax=Pelagicoccus sp. SDUM812005 TaxID=3041257 RepID=UPI00280FD546|nr:metallophosphoesterase [Pelagicoccus sp. SDUM812005]MDQ8181882.1 metallophosphoesterase [Pelagicoccus sp. SDUM812005]